MENVLSFRNRKGQIATALAVMIALAFSAAALFSILSFADKFNFQSSEFDRITSQLNFIQNYLEFQSKEFGKILATKCKDCPEEEIRNLASRFERERTIKFDNEGNFFTKLRNGEFTFQKQDENFLLQFKEITIQTSTGQTKLERKFDLCQLFNPEGEFISDCETAETQKPEDTSEENPETEDSESTSEENPETEDSQETLKDDSEQSE